MRPAAGGPAHHFGSGSRSRCTVKYTSTVSLFKLGQVQLQQLGLEGLGILATAQVQLGGIVDVGQGADGPAGSPQPAGVAIHDQVLTGASAAEVKLTCGQR